MLVDQIVTAHWRLRRALSAESGEIALNVDSGQRRRDQKNPVLQWTAFGDPIHAMEESSIGNSILQGWLGDVRKSVEVESALTEAAVQALAGHFGGKPNSLVDKLEAFRRKLETDPDRLDAELRERQKAAAAIGRIMARMIATF